MRFLLSEWFSVVIGSGDSFEDKGKSVLEGDRGESVCPWSSEDAEVEGPEI
jgi:hypothetical protein